MRHRALKVFRCYLNLVAGILQSVFQRLNRRRGIRRRYQIIPANNRRIRKVSTVASWVCGLWFGFMVSLLPVKSLIENARQAVSNIAAFQSVDLSAHINLTMKITFYFDLTLKLFVLALQRVAFVFVFWVVEFSF